MGEKWTIPSPGCVCSVYLFWNPSSIWSRNYGKSCFIFLSLSQTKEFPWNEGNFIHYFSLIATLNKAADFISSCHNNSIICYNSKHFTFFLLFQGNFRYEYLLLELYQSTLDISINIPCDDVISLSLLYKRVIQFKGIISTVLCI